MSTLILVFHPHLKDGSRVNARLLAELAAQGEDDIIVRDEYAEYPNFSVNADTEHELLEAADRVILQFPFYWYSSPALLKEWEDEVITAGWAYAGAHALKGKELKLVVTTGSDAAKYRKDGEYSHTMEELLSPFEVVAYKVGMNYAEPFLVQGTATIGDAELNQAAADYVSHPALLFFRGQAAGSLPQSASLTAPSSERAFFGSEGVDSYFFNGT